LTPGAGPLTILSIRAASTPPAATRGSSKGKGPMEFSLIYELEMPKPWAPGREQQIFQEAIEQIKLADQFGYRTAWSVEHHFLAEYSHSSSPEVWLAAAAAQTKNIRIGHGVKLLPFPYNHPIRVAESVATMDIVSNGRVEFGTGRSVTGIELEGFGINPDQTRDMWDESLDIVMKAWANEYLEHEGKLLTIPRRQVVPKPIQKPHPPLWLAGVAPETFEVAGSNGMGALTFAFSSEQISHNEQIYRKAIAACTKPRGKFINNKYASFCLPLFATDKATVEIGVEGARWFLQHVTEILITLARIESESYGYLKKAIDLDHQPKDAPFDDLYNHPLIICGDVDYCIGKLEKIEALGVDEVLLFMQRGNVPHDKIMKSIEVFGEQVLPHFAKKAAPQRAAQ
jgi:alkanesulfonate monooxygenase SsuD/methylene tetrahydromethanopterin reductase-like flavin-dependent oxidoreductase (luciferase family)